MYFLPAKYLQSMIITDDHHSQYEKCPKKTFFGQKVPLDFFKIQKFKKKKIPSQKLSMSNFNFYPPTSPSSCKKGLKFGAQICAEKLLLCHVKNSEPKPFFV